MDAGDYFRLEILRAKVTKSETGLDKDSSRLRVRIQSCFSEQDAYPLQSESTKLSPGAAFKIPCEAPIQKIRVDLLNDGKDFSQIGTGVVDERELAKLRDEKRSKNEPIFLSCYIYSVANETKIAKIYFKGIFRTLFTDDADKNPSRSTIKVSPNKSNRAQKKDTQSDHQDSVILPNFRFQPLSRHVSWNKVRALNLSRIIDKCDTGSLMSCLADVMNGDVSGEDVDSDLLSTINIAQLSAQYLNSSIKMMDQKKLMMETALNAFDEEDMKLDNEITKLKAKNKALMKENMSLDEIFSQYQDLLQTLDPELAERHERKVYATNMQEAYEREKERGKERELEVAAMREKERMKQREFENMLMREKAKENVLKRKVELERLRVNRLALEEEFAKSGVKASELVWPPNDFKESMKQIRETDDSSVVAFEEEVYTPGEKIETRDDRIPGAKSSNLKSPSQNFEDLSITDFEVDDGIDPQSALSDTNGLRTEQSGKDIIRTVPREISEDVDASEAVNTNGRAKEAAVDDEEIHETRRVVAPSARIIKSVSVRSLASRSSSHGSQLSEMNGDEEVKQNQYLPPTELEDLDDDFGIDDEPLDPKPIFSSTANAAFQGSGKGVSVHGSVAASTTSMSVDSLAALKQPFAQDVQEKKGESKEAPTPEKSNTEEDDFSVVDLSQSQGRSSGSDGDNEVTLSPKSLLKSNKEKFASSSRDSDGFEYTIGDRAMKEDDDVLLGTAKLSSHTGSSATSASISVAGEEFGLDWSSKIDVPVPFEESFDEEAEKGEDEREAGGEDAVKVTTPTSSAVRWSEGRCSIDLLEIGQALEVFIASVWMERVVRNGYASLQIKFLQVLSNVPSEFSLNSKNVHPVNYASHIEFNKQACSRLTAAIEEERESLSIEILVVIREGDELEVVGKGFVNLWRMIEISCNLVRQEVDVFPVIDGRIDESSPPLGVIALDVKGHHLLRECHEGADID